MTFDPTALPAGAAARSPAETQAPETQAPEKPAADANGCGASAGDVSVVAVIDARIARHEAVLREHEGQIMAHRGALHALKDLRGRLVSA